MFKSNRTIPAIVKYVPKPYETIEYLKDFFQTRIKELEVKKAELEKDKESYKKEISMALRGQSRFSMEYLEDFVLTITERLKDVNDNITINRYHLYGDTEMH